MSIRQILYFSVSVMLCMTITLVVLSLNFSSKIDIRMKNASVAADLARSTAELTLLIEEYIAYRLERIDRQWASKVHDIKDLVSLGTENELAFKLSRDIDLLDIAFTQLRQTIQKTSRAEIAGDSRLVTRLRTLENRRTSRIRLLNINISQLAFELSTKSRDEVHLLQKRINQLVTIYALLLVGVLLISGFLLIGIIARKLKILDDSVKAIGQGDFDLVVPDLGRDEIGALGNALNLMSSRLVEQAKTEKANTETIRQNEERFRDFAEAAADYFWESDDRFSFNRIEGSFELVTGQKPESMIGQDLKKFCTQHEGNQQVSANIAALIASRQPVDDMDVFWHYSADETRVITINAKPVFTPENKFIGYRGTGRDVTEHQILTAKLNFQATHDSLTDLINRREFERRLQHLLESAQNDDGEHILCYLDLDQFKVINDTCGHMAGDELLRQIVAVIRNGLRSRDTLARLGGDEFGILMEHCSMSSARKKAAVICKMVDEFRFVWQEQVHNIGVSVGIVSMTVESENILQTLSDADAACYAAKEKGGNCHVVFRQDDALLSSRHNEMQWVTRINRALDEDRFRLFYQEIFDAKKPQIENSHIEILLRLEDENGVINTPGSFFPAAERFNLSTRLDRWVVQNTFDWLAGNPIRMAQMSMCAINLSGHSVGDNSFKDFVLQLFETTSVPPEKICFEITETAAIRNLPFALELMKALREMKCKFALDDFGSGLSSFTYLKTLPVDYLKIDGAFITGMGDGLFDIALVKSINELGHLLGMKTIAEYVENEGIAEKLDAIGVDYYQGYHFGRPRCLLTSEQSSAESPNAEVIPIDRTKSSLQKKGG